MSHRRSPRLSAPSSPVLHRTEVEDGEGSHTTRGNRADSGPVADGGSDVQLFGDEDAASHDEAEGGANDGPSTTAENEAGDGEGTSGQFIPALVRLMVREASGRGFSDTVRVSRLLLSHSRQHFPSVSVFGPQSPMATMWGDGDVMSVGFLTLSLRFDHVSSSQGTAKMRGVARKHFPAFPHRM